MIDRGCICPIFDAWLACSSLELPTLTERLTRPSGAASPESLAAAIFFCCVRYMIGLPDGELSDSGFREASVPKPSSVVILAALGGFALLAYRTRR